MVSAGKGGSEGASDEYVLERRSGREVLPAVLGSADRLLEPGDLAKLARAARSLDDHEGRGMEIEFDFSAGKLYLMGARPIPGLGDEPAPQAAPFTVAVPAAATVPPVMPLRP